MRHLFLMAAQGIIQAVPVEVGIIEMQLDAVSLARIGEFLEHITLEGGGVDDVVVAGSALEHRETVVVARGDGNVAGTGILDGTHPCIGIEARRIEAGWQLGILVTANALVEHHPLAIGQHGIDTPVNEHTQFIVLELLAGTQVLLAGNIGRLLGTGRKPCSSQQDNH